MVDIAGFFERLGGALLVIFAAFIIVPIVLGMGIMGSLDAVSLFFIVIACVMIFVGAILYIVREKQYS
jgi:hypothetical protein